MKYCKNCGMLLEDTHERCIGCGIDVTNADNVSKYPPQMQQTIEVQKKETKTRRGIVFAIVLVFVLLLALVGVIISQASKFTEPETEPKETVEESTEQSMSESPDTDATQTEALSKEPLQPAAQSQDTEVEAEEQPVDSRAVKDDRGSYYIYFEKEDAGGNLVFSSLYPEDMKNADAAIDYEKYSTKYPQLLTFAVSNEDNTVRFTYMSMQQFWQKASETGKSRNNERDLDYYMSYLGYDGAQGYIEAMIKQGYKDIKKVKLIEKVEADPKLTEELGNISKDYTKSVTGDIGDYAHIGEDTTYATMEAEFSAEILKYEITTKDNQVLYCDFYVPLIANDFYYANDDSDDRGTVTEWIALNVMGFEAGNEELYDQFEEAFFVFMKNTKVHKQFYYTNVMYGKEIETAITENKDPKLLDEKKLADYKKKYSESADIGDLNEAILKFTNTQTSQMTEFSGDEMTVDGAEDVKAVFYNSQTKTVFITPDETEYPGADYVELKGR